MPAERRGRHRQRRVLECENLRTPDFEDMSPIIGPARPLRLAELLATRLCHDFSGPLGTLMGSLEMLTEEPDSAAEALTLATDVANSLTGRLRLLRAAWAGATGPLAPAALCAMAAHLQTRRARLDFTLLETTAEFSASAARVTLNVLMLAAESLGGNGVVHLSGDPSREMLVTLEGPRAAWPAGFAGHLAQDALAWQAFHTESGLEASRLLQGPLTALIARGCGVRLSLLLGGRGDAPPPLLIQPG